jgi:hypothetical protein
VSARLPEIWWSQAESNRRPLECHSNVYPLTKLAPYTLSPTEPAIYMGLGAKTLRLGLAILRYELVTYWKLKKGVTNAGSLS